VLKFVLSFTPEKKKLKKFHTSLKINFTGIYNLEFIYACMLILILRGRDLLGSYFSSFLNA
jgi:hypothetical protein